MTESVEGFFDISDLPTRQVYGITKAFEVSDRIMQDVRAAIASGIRTGHYGEKLGSGFGFALSAPMHVDSVRGFAEHWNELNRVVWLVGGEGHMKNLLIANAVRKLRPLIRNGQDTLSLATSLHAHRHFVGIITDHEYEIEKETVRRDPTHSQFRWGDFPWGGGVRIEFGHTVVFGALSGGTQQEDHVVISHAINELMLGMSAVDAEEAVLADGDMLVP
jgi:hypothetical protein